MPLPVIFLPDARFSPDRVHEEGEPVSIYLHVPFCRTRCSYCDFFLVTRLDHVESFFRALSSETLASAPLLRGRRVKAVHIGGGTPSLVPVSFISGWLDLLSTIGDFEPEAEIALEANPEDLGGPAMRELRSAGVNRLSLGVQSFQQRKLSALGRRHSADDARRITGQALQVFDTLSVDLICGVPGESSAEWQKDLQDVMGLAVPHVSVYMLSVEPKTRLERRISRGLVTVPGETVQASMYSSAVATLCSSGYRHYEVSNFAFPGHHSRYNLACWMREPYLGFGPSAHSFVRKGRVEVRRANAGSLLRYLAGPPASSGIEETLTEEERFVEQVFLTLRINRGLDVGILRKRDKLGLNLQGMLERFHAKGWIVLEDGCIFLTGSGFLFADHIAGELISLET